MEEPTENNRQRILIYPIHNEVIPQRLFPALLDPEVVPLFEVAAFAGRPSKKDIVSRLYSEITKRKGYGSGWRDKHTMKENGSLQLMIDFINHGFPYFQLNDTNFSVPREAYDLCDAVFIGTNNLTHIPYAIDAFKHDKHILSEKPYAVTERDLEAAKSLENLIQYQKDNGGVELAGKITAHYPHKPASLALLNNIGEMVQDYGKITNVEGHIEELDEPTKQRTIATLNPHTSGGGIYQDTCSHLYTILFALGAEVKSDDTFEWDPFHGYGAETYARANHTVNGQLFSEDAKVDFTVGKFIDRYVNPKHKEHKELILDFEDGSKAHVLFGEGKIDIRKNGKKVKEIEEDHPSNEYVSVAKDFQGCIVTGNDSFTSTSIGIKVMETILSVYQKFYNGTTAHRVRKYK